MPNTFIYEFGHRYVYTLCSFFLSEWNIRNLQCVKKYTDVKNDEFRSDLKDFSLRVCYGVRKVNEMQMHVFLFIVVFPNAYIFFKSSNIL